MSRILNNVSPFSEDLLRHTEAQLDFIMEMYSIDHPDEYEFVRPGKPKPMPAPELQAQWERRLIGQAKGSFLKPMLPSAAVLQKAAQIPAMLAKLKKASEAG